MKIHFVGSGGVSMSLLMKLCKARGDEVSGSDEIFGGHKKENVNGCDLVVYTNAVSSDNVELAEAKKQGIPTVERAEFLGSFSRGFKTVIAAAGSHGKTTTTAMLYGVFGARNPTLHIGGKIDGCEYVGGNDYFITEACEYKRSFLHLKPNIGIVLNSELDHTDYYKDRADIVSAFKAFIDLCGLALINGDDEELKKFECEQNVFTFGISNNCDFSARGICQKGGKYMFTLFFGNAALGEIYVNAFGRHNIYNALAAASAGVLCGLPISEIKEGLKNFTPPKRRFEFLGKAEKADVFTDYAHHPTEINALLGAARSAGYKDITAVFEPHTFSRTKDLFEGFVEALSGFERVVLADVFKSREQKGEVGSKQLFSAISGKGVNCVFPASYPKIIEYLNNDAKGDCIIFVGAGTIDKCAADFIKTYNPKKAESYK